MEFTRLANDKKFHGKNILAIDYGEQVIGLASFCIGRDPFPVVYGKIISENASDSNIIKQLCDIVEQEAVEILVFGLPFYADGTVSKMGEKIQLFAQKLQKVIAADIPLYFQDETLSTQEAKQRMLNSAQYNFQINPKQLDGLSAVIILERFITHIES